MLLEPERAVLVRRAVRGGDRFGSGVHVFNTAVLTARHCTNGRDLHVLFDGRWLPVTAVQTLGEDVDLALLTVDGIPPVEALDVVHLDRSRAMSLEGCVALGFPRWKLGASGDRYLAHVSGWIPVLDGLGAIPGPESNKASLRLQDPATRPAPRGAMSRTQWAGMSGAGVYWRSGADDYLVGILCEHPVAEGDQSLALTPMSVITSKTLGGDFFAAMGVFNWRSLRHAPAVEDRTIQRLHRIAAVVNLGLVGPEAARELQVNVMMKDLMDGGLDVI